MTTKIEITVTDDNEFNDGWLRYLLGFDRPKGEQDEDKRWSAIQNGWDMGADTPTVKMIRHVFTRQNDIEHPQYIVREVPDKQKATPAKAEPIVVGE
jgi:hypothetical protein